MQSPNKTKFLNRRLEIRQSPCSTRGCSWAAWLSTVVLFFVTGCDNEPVSTVTTRPEAKVTQEPPPLQKSKISTEVEGTATYRPDNTIGAEKLGIPLYPNANLRKSGIWDIRDPRDGSEALTALQLQSEDPLSKVAAFYRQKVGNAQIIEINRPSGKRISITVSLPDQTTTNLVLYEDGPGTRIEITKLGQNEDAAKQ